MSIELLSIILMVRLPKPAQLLLNKTDMILSPRGGSLEKERPIVRSHRSDSEELSHAMLLPRIP